MSEEMSIKAVAFDENGVIYVASNNHVQNYEFRKPDEICTEYLLCIQGVKCMAANGKRKRLLIGTSRRITAYCMANKKKIQKLNELDIPDQPILLLCNQEYFCVMRYDLIKIYDMNTMEEKFLMVSEYLLPQTVDMARRPCLTPSIVFSVKENQICVVNCSQLNNRSYYNLHPRIEVKMDFNIIALNASSTKIAVGSVDGTEILLMHVNGTPFLTLHRGRYPAQLSSIHFSPANNLLVATSSSTTVHIFDSRNPSLTTHSVVSYLWDSAASLVSTAGSKRTSKAVGYLSSSGSGSICHTKYIDGKLYILVLQPFGILDIFEMTDGDYHCKSIFRDCLMDIQNMALES